MTKVKLCMVVLNRLDEMKRSLSAMSPYVDSTCICDGGSTDGTIEWLGSDEAKSLGIKYQVVKQHRYAVGNHTPNARNPYLTMAGPNCWILEMDSDEVLEERALQNIHRLIELAEENGCTGVSFKAHDIWTYETGEVYDKVSDYQKPALFKSCKGIHYAGATHSHIVRPGLEEKWMQTDFEYEHRKTERSMWRSSTFLYWTTSKVADNVTNDETWLEFHRMMQRHGYYDWHDLDKDMNKGGISQELKDWFIEHRNDENPEAAAWFIHYFVMNHVNENVNKISCDRYDRYTWDYLEKAEIKKKELEASPA